MTVFTASTDLPSNINSLEKLALWVGTALERVNPTSSVLESPGIPSRVAQAAIIRADDGSKRVVIRLSLPLAEDYASNNTVKFWQNALDLSNTALPSAFKIN